MISNAYLLGLYGVSSGAASTGGATAPATLRKQPTAPWSGGDIIPQADELVRRALGGRRIINEGEARLDLKGASDDYRKLFAVYQGLETLNALSNRAAVKGVSEPELNQLNRRFAAGLDELGTYLSGAGLEGVRLVQGASKSTSRSTAAVAKDSAVYVTAPVHEGGLDQPVAAFQGAVAFDVRVRKNNVTTTVAIDLNGMGATPRTLEAVTAHINSQLKAAGFDTTLGRRAVKAEPKTLTVNGKTVTLPAGPDRWAMEVRGVSTETISFSAPQSTSVQVVQGTGRGFQLLKFDPAATGAARAGETNWVDGRLSQSGLPDGVEAVRASAAGPDGSTWIVADLSAGPGNQPIKGQGDVALMRFDSAGRLTLTRALGAASTASGYALSVAADGRVAVAGSVTGALEPGQSGEAATVADSFVTVFDAEGGELWTQRRGARAADEARSVGFATDGSVYVSGRAKSAMPGGAGLGDWDGYVQRFTTSQAYPGAPTTATAAGVVQFGSAGEDAVQATAINGSDLYTAGVEGGRLVVRRFTLNGAGAPTLAATRDLGLAGGGAISGLAVEGGRVILGGTTRNPALDIGAVNQAHAGGTDAFVAALQTDLLASVNDRLTYHGGAGDDTAADLKIAGGKAWITGVSNRPVGAKDQDPTRAYLARLDPVSGAVEWSRTWPGDGDTARPTTLSVAANGSSVLDRLGLPQGEIDQTPSKRLVDATSLRAGDRFFVSPAAGGRRVAVTVEVRDTLQTLARKIEQASNMKLKVTLTTTQADAVTGTTGQTAMAAAMQSLSIAPRDGETGAVLTSGESGRDALAGLGLPSGYIGASGVGDAVRTFGLNLPRTLTLQDKASVKAAGEALQSAMTAVRSAYRELAPKPKASAGGPAPAYLTDQLANYQAALARLSG